MRFQKAIFPTYFLVPKEKATKNLQPLLKKELNSTPRNEEYTLPYQQKVSALKRKEREAETRSSPNLKSDHLKKSGTVIRHLPKRSRRDARHTRIS